MPRLTKSLTQSFSAVNVACAESAKYSRDVVVPRLTQCGAHDVGAGLMAHVEAVSRATERFNELLIAQSKRK